MYSKSKSYKYIHTHTLLKRIGNLGGYHLINIHTQVPNIMKNMLYLALGQPSSIHLADWVSIESDPVVGCPARIIVNCYR
jgi:hypothetical protein